MVGELPELQGIMGRYYALESNEHPEVAQALDEQYMPRYAGAALPETATGKILALADKLDTLVGIFAIGKAPTGDKDPFGLRRAGLGCLRIMIECALPLDLEACIAHSSRTYPKDINARSIASEVFDFMLERLRRYYLDNGVSPPYSTRYRPAGRRSPMISTCGCWQWVNSCNYLNQTAW